jgi:hypothetical protein
VIGDEYWAWQVQDPNGEWGAIGLVFDDELAPMIVRHRHLAEKVRPIAEEHGRESGKPIRLAHFTLKEVES